MKFEDFKYVRPVMETIEERFNACLDEFEKATSYQKQSELIETINSIRQGYSSMYNICHIRHTINTKNAFYEEENNFFDQNNPSISALTTRYYKLLLASPFKEELAKEWGRQLFVIAELSIKTFQQEAANAKWRFYSDNQAAVEEIFDKQVKLRHSIAQKLGYKNFIELGYARMLRSDYNAEMVANFRKQVEEFIVTIASEWILSIKMEKRLEDTVLILTNTNHLIFFLISMVQVAILMY